MGETFEQGHALIIGVGADLPATIDDAVGLADVLKNPRRCAYPSDQILLLTGEQATAVNIRLAFEALVEATNAESTVIVYFSGHGTRIISPAGESYHLMPYGYALTRLPQTTVSGAELAEWLRAIPAKKLLVLLDCCHAGGVGEAKASGLQLKRSPLPSEVQSLPVEGRSRVLIASSQEDELSFVGRPYSAFTLALLEALCGAGVAKKDGYVHAADLAMHAREVVPRRTDDKQHPILHFEQTDNFPLAYYAGGETRPRGLPFVFIRVEPFRPSDRVESAQFPPQHLISKLEPVRQAIAQVLRFIRPERVESYFQYADQVIEYLTHVVGLLPSDKWLSELEMFILIAAAYLHAIGHYFPWPEHTLTLERRMTAAKDRDLEQQVSQLVREHYHELSWEWIKNSLEDSSYPPLGLVKTDPVSEIALVCLGHREADLDDEKYRTSGTGSKQVRPALLVALLSIAVELTWAQSKPVIGDLKQSQESFETQVLDWLRHYLDRVSIQGGHIRFHYQLPTEDYSLSVRVLLSGPLQLRLREIRGILSENGIVIALDSSVTDGPVYEMPPDVLAHAQKLALQRLTSTIAALGQPSKPRFHYHFTGLRGRPTLRWDSMEGAEFYQGQLFDMAQRLIAKWETAVPELTLPEAQIEPGEQYEWIVYAYRGKRRLRQWEGGIFWLLDKQTVHWADRQTAWYDAPATLECQLMQGRILANYGLYEEASSVCQTILEQGTGMVQLQARQELMWLYQDISRQLDRLNRPSRADRYLDAALTLAKQLQTRVSQERIEMAK